MGDTSLVTNIGRLFTSTGRGVLTDAAVLIDSGLIAWVGTTGDGPPHLPDEVVDVEGALVTPGLIDAHTHPLYAGDRLAEIAQRSAGAGYEEVASAGGGIRSTVAATRAASRDDLAASLTARLTRWLAAGTTTVEAKSGYHLDHDGEIAAVALLAEMASRPDLPRVEVTFLGAHDVGPERGTGDDAYAVQAKAVARWCPDAARAGARFVDVFCDAGYFTVSQARHVLAAGHAAGLRPRIHADELTRTGACLLAAELGAVSADHLLCATDDDARALAHAGVVATLCPVTALALGRMPLARAFLDHGVELALGSDHNPGQSGVTDMSLVVGLTVHLLGLSIEEALAAATTGGAAAVAAPERGSIRAGQVADLVSWDTEHEGAFAWQLPLVARRVWKGGRQVRP